MSVQRVHDPEAKNSLPFVAAPAPIVLRRCELLVLRGGALGRSFRFAGDVIRIGKAESNDLVLVDDTVSRVHCEILADSRGHLLRDLGSTNGTFLDGSEVKEAYLRAGAVVSVGEVQLRFDQREERIKPVASPSERLGAMVGSSLQLRNIFGVVPMVAPTDASVLIEGEAGSGKMLLAQTIHEASLRAGRPLAFVDCATLPVAALEAALFGSGGYPLVADPSEPAGTELEGAQSHYGAQRGVFERAAGSTVVLRRVEALPVSIQGALLRVLERRELVRAGSERSVRIDLRFIATARESLLAEIQRGRFREDLYFRLAVVPLTLPPLRERREDIPSLVALFANEGGPEGGDGVRGVPSAALQFLLAHDWPGNVRELRDVVERAMFPRGGLDDSGDAAALDAWLPTTGTPVAGGAAFEEAASYRQTKERWNDLFEAKYLRWLLERAGGNISQAAREAEMDRKYLHKLMRKHAIERGH